MNLYRLHLKTDATDRNELVSYCMNNDVIAIGWSNLYKENNIKCFEDFVMCAESDYKKVPSAIQYFSNVETNDLIWIRDLDGKYYICRVLEKAKHHYDLRNDIGCIIPVEKYCVGTNAPGKIVRAFIPSRIIQRVNGDSVLNISKILFNEKSKRNEYGIDRNKIDFFSMIHPFDLEELVMIYIQLEYDYYLSKNSISGNDTTIKIEGELFPRKKNPHFRSAVLQVKSGESFVEVKEYLSYVNDGKLVFLFFENENYSEEIDGVINIGKEELLKFISNNKELLPPIIKSLADTCNL